MGGNVGGMSYGIFGGRSERTGNVWCNGFESRGTLLILSDGCLVQGTEETRIRSRTKSPDTQREK